MHQFTESDAPRLLYGADPTPGIVAVEPAGPNEVHVYRRLDDGTTRREPQRFDP
ncbi:MAG TPA: hypothetical protein VD767_03210 [Thermomicrobiales bacterium]|nr:hypothetical protein [Thermomicrobiales bacterium]